MLLKGREKGERIKKFKSFQKIGKKCIKREDEKSY
jgi:hypothetical protein